KIFVGEPFSRLDNLPSNMRNVLVQGPSAHLTQREALPVHPATREKDGRLADLNVFGCTQSDRNVATNPTVQNWWRVNRRVHLDNGAPIAGKVLNRRGPQFLDGPGENETGLLDKVDGVLGHIHPSCRSGGSPGSRELCRRFLPTPQACGSQRQTAEMLPPF